jgi:hypothetical protein
LENANRRQTIALAHQDPTLAARNILRRNDIAADWIGDVLAITLCRVVTPARMYFDGKYNGKCYKAPVAVMDDGTVMFSVPDTDDLIMYGSPVPCINHHSPMWRTSDGRFRNNVGAVHVQKAPHMLNTQQMALPADDVV